MRIQPNSFKPNELILKMKRLKSTPESAEPSHNKLTKSLGFTVLETYDFGSVFKNDDDPIIRVALPKDMTITEALDRLEKRDDIVYAEPNFTLERETLPSTPATQSQNSEIDERQYALHNEGQKVLGNRGVEDSDVDAPEGWEIIKQCGVKRPTVYAVIDGGVDYHHKDLKDAIWTNHKEIPGNGIDDDKNGYIDDVHGIDAFYENGNPMDGDDHGTHCAGIIGARHDQNGTQGVDPNAIIMPIKIFNQHGRTDVGTIIRALAYASKNGAHITSNSWGGVPHSRGLIDAFANSPALHFMATDNRANDYDRIPDYPGNFPIDNNVVVTASDNRDKKARFAGFGKINVDVAAPGVDIISTVPKNKYAYMSGTSMATPLVAGIGGAVLSVYPQLSHAELKQVLYNSVDKKEDLDGKIATEGRVNLENALEEARKLIDSKKAD